MPKPKIQALPDTSEGTTASYATLIVQKVGEELALLLGRNWSDIEDMLRDKQEISISAKIDISDRKAEPGTQATKDSRIKTTISFSKKYSDSCEVPIPDPAQGEMDLSGGES